MNLIIKGYIIGIAKIIPGVSGAMLAISFGIYDKIIEIISNLKRTTKKEIIFLSKIGAGIIIAISLTSKIIVKCLNKYYLPTMLLFIGLIIGTMPNIIKKAKIKKIDITISIIIILIIILITKNIDIKNHSIIEYTKIDYIKLILVGIMDAASSIIPGISGTALLMMVGYYDIIIKAFSTILSPTEIKSNIFIISAFIIGFILGILILSKIINLFMKKSITITLIIFFMITTIIQLLIMVIGNSYSILEVIIGTILLIIGTTLSNRLNKQ